MTTLLPALARLRRIEADALVAGLPLMERAGAAAAMLASPARPGTNEVDSRGVIVNTASIAAFGTGSAWLLPNVTSPDAAAPGVVEVPPLAQADRPRAPRARAPPSRVRREKPLTGAEGKRARYSASVCGRDIYGLLSLGG